MVARRTENGGRRRARKVKPAPKNVEKSVTHLSGFAGYRCATHEPTERKKGPGEWKVK